MGTCFNEVVIEGDWMNVRSDIKHDDGLQLLNQWLDLKYSQPCLSRSRISRISPKSKVYTRHHSFIFYCFLPHISRIFSKSKLFLQSQEIRLRQGWLYMVHSIMTVCSPKYRKCMWVILVPETKTQKVAFVYSPVKGNLKETLWYWKPCYCFLTHSERRPQNIHS